MNHILKVLDILIVILFNHKTLENGYYYYHHHFIHFINEVTGAQKETSSRSHSWLVVEPRSDIMAYDLEMVGQCFVLYMVLSNCDT